MLAADSVSARAIAAIREPRRAFVGDWSASEVTLESASLSG